MMNALFCFVFSFIIQKQGGNNMISHLFTGLDQNMKMYKEDLVILFFLRIKTNDKFSHLRPFCLSLYTLLINVKIFLYYQKQTA